MKINIFFLFLITLILASCFSSPKVKQNSKLNFLGETDLPGWELVGKPTKIDEIELGKSKILYSEFLARSLSRMKFKSLDVDKNISLHIEIVEFANKRLPYELYTNIKNFGESKVYKKIRFHRYNNYIISGIDNYFVKCKLSGDLDRLPDIEKRLILKNTLQITIGVISNSHKGNLSQWRLAKNEKVLFRGKEGSDDNYLISYSGTEIKGFEKVIFQNIFIKGKEFKIFSFDMQNKDLAFKKFNYLLRKNSDAYFVKDKGIQSIVKENIRGTFSFVSHYKNWIYGLSNVENMVTGGMLMNEIKKSILREEGE